MNRSLHLAQKMPHLENYKRSQVYSKSLEIILEKQRGNSCEVEIMYKKVFSILRDNLAIASATLLVLLSFHSILHWYCLRSVLHSSSSYLVVQLTSSCESFKSLTTLWASRLYIISSYMEFCKSFKAHKIALTLPFQVRAFHQEKKPKITLIPNNCEPYRQEQPCPS